MLNIFCLFDSVVCQVVLLRNTDGGGGGGGGDGDDDDDDDDNDNNNNSNERQIYSFKGDRQQIVVE